MTNILENQKPKAKNKTPEKIKGEKKPEQSCMTECYNKQSTKQQARNRNLKAKASLPHRHHLAYCVTTGKMLSKSLMMPSSVLRLLIISSCVKPTQKAGLICCAFLAR